MKAKAILWIAGSVVILIFLQLQRYQIVASNAIPTYKLDRLTGRVWYLDPSKAHQVEIR